VKNIRYIGTDAICKAFFHQTGIIWTPGMTATVLDDRVADQMTKYVSVFEDAGDSQAVVNGLTLDPTTGAMQIGGAAPTSAQRASVRAGIGVGILTTADVYVDSLTGHDSNPGTLNAPFKSLAMVSGDQSQKVIAVRNGRTYLNTLDASGAGVVVVGHGDGDPAVIDCTDTVHAASWVKTDTLTNVYDQTITLPEDVKSLGNVYCDGVALLQVTSTALCDSTPGSAYVSDWTAASATLYIHPTGSVSPITDGREYRYSARLFGINLSGDACTVSGIRVRGNAHQDGGIRLTGRGCLVTESAAVDGCRHAMYVGPGAVLSGGVYGPCRNALEAPGTANTVVINNASAVGEGYSATDVTFSGTGYSSVTGPLMHDGTPTTLFGAQTLTDCEFNNLASWMTASGAPTNVIRPKFFGVTAGAGLGAAGTVLNITDGTGSVNQLYDATVGGSVNVSGGNFVVSALPTGFFRANSTATDLALSITDAEVTANTGAFPAHLVRNQRGSVNIQGLTVNAPQGASALCAPIDVTVSAGFSGGTVAYFGAGNTWHYGASFQINGVTYNTLAEFQAAGHEVGSTVLQPTVSGSDNFNRADENLEATAPWVRIGGSAAQAAVRTNALACIGTTQTLYEFSGISLPVDQYVRFKIASVPATANPYVVVRASDQSNWVGVRWNATTFMIGRCIAGTVTASVTSSAAVAPAIGDDVILAIRGDLAYLYVNGRCLLRGQAMSATAIGANTKVGVVARSGVVNPFIDDFSAGAI